jgi:hypothetical protein
VGDEADEGKEMFVSYICPPLARRLSAAISDDEPSEIPKG